jgi:hypothetical protein
MGLTLVALGGMTLILLVASRALHRTMEVPS